MARDEIVIRLIEVSDVDINSVPLLTDEDKNVASKFRLADDKAMHLLSAYFKRKYVGEWKINDHGKPISDKIYFNISHCKGAVVFVASDSEIGVDIELVKPTDKLFVDRITSEEERQFINSDADFYKIWTSKESLAKAAGTGVDRAVKKIPALPLCGGKNYGNENYCSSLTTYDNYIISVTRKGTREFDIRLVKERI